MPHSQLSRKRRRGEALLEFTLVGIPLLFVWISTVEMARGMWQYHTLQYATKMTNAYAATHGATCGSPNSCSVNVSNVVGLFQTLAIGIPMNQVKIVLSTANNSVTCNQVSTCSTNASWSSTWPTSSSGDNAVGKTTEVRTYYTFYTALGMFWPGAGKAWSFGSAAGSGEFIFPGYSYELIQF